MALKKATRSARSVIFCVLCFISIVSSLSIAQDVEVHEFITETARFYDNELVTDGSHLFGVRYDGYMDGKGVIFKTGMNGEDFEVIHNFDDPLNGYNPVGTLALAGSTLYGMTVFGGTSDVGIIFKIETDGSGFHKLFDFDLTNGALPYASLIVSGSVLYGTTLQGGEHSMGVTFRIGTDGTNFLKLIDFDGSNGWNPMGALAISGDVLYGVTNRGGTYDRGLIYKIQTNGEGRQTLFRFREDTGYGPYSGLIVAGTTLYGTTGQGGSTEISGGVFRINTDGTGFEHFPGLPASAPNGKLTLINNRLYGMTANGGYANGIIYTIDLTNKVYYTLHEFNITDGRNPSGSLLLANDKLYGYVPGGIHGYGVMFSIEPNGNNFQVLKDFEATNTGFNPRGGLIFTTGRAYGITSHGGTYNSGVIYSIKHDGTDYRVVYNFEDAQGSHPEVSLLLSDDLLYGVTLLGGNSKSGVLFRVDTTGSNYEVIHHFNRAEGFFPSGSLVDSGGELLYGVASGGGPASNGVVFQVNKETREVKTVFDFSDTDARNPRGTLVLADSVLFGLALGGVGDGIVFSVKTDGTDFRKLVDKDSQTAGRYGNSLALKDSILYVTMAQGGSVDYGVLFSVKTDGSKFKNLFTFRLANGGIPEGAIIVTDTLIYGMTLLGGEHNSGVSYSIQLNGDGYRRLFSLDNSIASPSGRGKTSGNMSSAFGSISVFNEVLYATVTLQSQQSSRGSIRRYNLRGTNAPDPVTGMMDDETAIHIFPNPTSSVITIVGNARQAISLVDSSGRRIPVSTAEGASVDVTYLAPGVYYLLVGRKSFRFVKW